MGPTCGDNKNGQRCGAMQESQMNKEDDVEINPVLPIKMQPLAVCVYLMYSSKEQPGEHL